MTRLDTGDIRLTSQAQCPSIIRTGVAQPGSVPARPGVITTNPTQLQQLDQILGYSFPVLPPSFPSSRTAFMENFQHEPYPKNPLFYLLILYNTIKLILMSENVDPYDEMFILRHDLDGLLA